MTCGQVWWPLLRICALYLTHRTHTAVSSEQTHKGLAQGSHLSHGIEGGVSAGHSLPHLQSLPDLRLEPMTFGLQVRLYPLGPVCPKIIIIFILF